MTELQLVTAAFGAQPPKRRRSVRSRLSRPISTGAAQEQEVVSTVRFLLVLTRGSDSITIEVETSEGDEWTPVSPTALKVGLVAILQRESRLEQTAARFGLATEALLSALEAAIVDLSDESAGTPAAELDVLRAAGVSLDGSPSDPAGAAQVALGVARAQAFRDEALTVADAASTLDLSPGRVRQLVAERRLLTMSSGDGGHLLPAWQFVAGRFVPGLEHVADAVEGIHPVTLAGFMNRADADLEVEGTPVSPAEWLISGGDPAAVAELAAGLSLPA